MDNPNRVGFTWRRRGRRASRLDRAYIPPNRVNDLCAPAEHHGHVSDHDALVFSLECNAAPSRSKFHSNYWKLNKSILLEPNFNINFEDLFHDLQLTKSKYNTISDWFDLSFKPSMRNFLMLFSKERAKSRRDTLLFHSVALQLAVKSGDWEKVSFARSKLDQMSKEDSLGLVVRSRDQESSEQEKASLFHLNREVKKGKLSRLDKLAKIVVKHKNGVEIEEKIILHEREQIEEEVVGYFTKLFQGYHT